MTTRTATTGLSRTTKLAWITSMNRMTEIIWMSRMTSWLMKEPGKDLIL